MPEIRAMQAIRPMQAVPAIDVGVRLLLAATVGSALVLSAAQTRATDVLSSDAFVSAPATAPVRAETHPRLKLSYRQFSVSNLDGTAVPLKGAELDVYPMSRRWVRIGLELEAGAGHASLSGQSAHIRYGLLGVSTGFQYPGRVTPFLEARLVGGVLGGKLDAPLAIPGTTATLEGTSAVTWIYGRGIDAGTELFVIGRAYLSLSMGWLRTTWGGVDYAAMMQDPLGRIRYKSLSSDTFTLKLGIGI